MTTDEQNERDARILRVIEDRAEMSERIRDRAAEKGLDLPHLSIGMGWEGILNDLIDTIVGITGDRVHQVKVVQVKEKFGGLRFYAFSDLPEDQYDRVHTAIRDACDLSLTVCEVCGRPGSLEIRPSGWLATRCPDHFDTCADGTPADGGLLPGPGPDPHPNPYALPETEFGQANPRAKPVAGNGEEDPS